MDEAILAASLGPTEERSMGRDTAEREVGEARESLPTYPRAARCMSMTSDAKRGS